MSNAKRCDRCGKYFTPIKGEKRIAIKIYNPASIFPDDRNVVVDADLCLKCQRYLFEFLNYANHYNKDFSQKEWTEFAEETSPDMR